MINIAMCSFSSLHQSFLYQSEVDSILSSSFSRVRLFQLLLLLLSSVFELAPHLYPSPTVFLLVFEKKDCFHNVVYVFNKVVSFIHTQLVKLSTSSDSLASDRLFVTCAISAISVEQHALPVDS